MPEASSSSRPSRPPRLRRGYGGQGRRKRWFILAGFLLVLAALFAGWYAWMNRPAGRAEALIEEMRRREGGEVGLVDDLLARVGLGTAPKRSRDDIFDDLVALGPPAVPSLTGALKHPSATVRHYATWALGQIGHPGAVPSLLEAMDDPDVDVSKAAVVALGDIGDRRAVPRLLEVMNSPESDEVARVRAIIALRNIGDRQALPAILEAAAGDPKDWWQHGEALIALGRLGGPEALSRLAAALENGNESEHFSAAEGIGWLDAPESQPLLIKALSDSDRAVRSSAARGLQYVGDPSAAPALVAATRDPSFAVREAAVLGLAAIGAPEAGDAAVALLEDSDPQVRNMAALVCGIEGRTEALPILRECLFGPDYFEAHYAAVGLAMLGTPEARRALEEGAQSAHSPEVRRLAARALRIGLLPSLSEEVRAPNLNRQYLAVMSLHFLHDPAALPALEEARKTGRPDARQEAAHVIKHLRRLASTRDNR
jgi:HEAT repeat protein